MFRHLATLTVLGASIAAGAQEAPAARTKTMARVATNRLMERRVELGLDDRHSLVLRTQIADELGEVHARIQQQFNGVKVWGGEAISHLKADGNERALTNALHTGIRVSTTPSLSATEALGIAHADLAPKGAYTHEPTAELVIYPETREVVRPGARRVDAELNGADVTRQVTRYVLAYHVHTELINGAEETRSQDYLINAHNGAIIKSWDTLHRAGVTGTGKSQWYGTVNINTNSTASGFEMRDMTRGTGGTFGNNITTNMNKGTSGNGSIFTDADNAWGDGLQYNGTTGMGANAQTAAVDGHRGLQSTWDFFRNVFNRNGIDGTGKATFSRMHYSSNYDNAFWQDSCFCMTYGDGAPGGSVGEADLDTSAHEMTHGVTASTANLVYSGESGGLNESTSDIFGTAVEFYVLGGDGTGSVVPDNPGTGTKTANYTLFEQSFSNGVTPLRYMYKPSKDGSSKDAWYSGIGSIDVHFSSGPMNRAWYFMARGSSNVSSSDFYSSYLPGGMNGIGNDKAARIWYRALTTYLTSSSNYAAARTASINSAKDLYGAGGAEEQAVWNAFAAINVGSAWSGTTGPAITGQPASISVQAGSTATFSVTATGSALSYQWRKNGTAISGATAASYTTPATTTSDNGSTFSVVVSNAAGSVTSNNATLTVTSTPPGNNEVEPNNTSGTAQVVSTSGTTLNGTAGSSTDQDWFKVTLGAGRTITATLTPNASSDYDLYLYNSNLTQLASSVNGTGAVDTVTKKNTGTSAFARYVKVIYYSGTTGAAGTYTLKLTF